MSPKLSAFTSLICIVNASIHSRQEVFEVFHHCLVIFLLLWLLNLHTSTCNWKLVTVPHFHFHKTTLSGCAATLYLDVTTVCHMYVILVGSGCLPTESFNLCEQACTIKGSVFSHQAEWVLPCLSSYRVLSWKSECWEIGWWLWLPCKGLKWFAIKGTV